VRMCGLFLWEAGGCENTEYSNRMIQVADQEMELNFSDSRQSLSNCMQMLKIPASLLSRWE